MASQLKSQDQLRPMKETFHSRLHSTVLPRLGTIRMESHHNLHTHAIDLDIQLLGNNRVLKERPSSISDEDNDAALPQLRSGHCHLLQYYKHRVLGKPMVICTYCGASPQDVRHLFACTTHQLTCHQRIYGGSGEINSCV